MKLGVLGVLFVVMLVLKLAHLVDWSWWWVTAPVWIPLIMKFSLFVTILLYGSKR